MFWRIILKSDDGEKGILILEDQGIIRHIYTIVSDSNKLRKVHIATHGEDISDLIDRSERLDGIRLEKLGLKDAVLFAFKVEREELLGPIMKELKNYAEST